MSIPTVEELLDLPCRALVAFAARCARRVQPLFREWGPGELAPERYIRLVDQAISMAEMVGVFGGKCACLSTDVRVACTDALSHGATVAAISAATAAAEAAEAAEVLTAHPVGNLATIARVASRGAIQAGAINGEIARAVRGDFERLRQKAVAQKWTDNTPVPPHFFGGLLRPEDP